MRVWVWGRDQRISWGPLGMSQQGVQRPPKEPILHLWNTRLLFPRSMWCGRWLRPLSITQQPEGGRLGPDEDPAWVYFLPFLTLFSPLLLFPDVMWALVTYRCTCPFLNQKGGARPRPLAQTLSAFEGSSLSLPPPLPCIILPPPLKCGSKSQSHVRIGKIWLCTCVSCVFNEFLLLSIVV